MVIPEKKIEEIRSSTNILDIISESVQLKKRGRNYIGLCPFHQEKTPSFTVSEDKQIFHCFGCHAGGNVFKFLMDFESISFVESVQYLAKRLGIDLEYEENSISQAQSEQEILYDINTFAARYFSKNLLQHPQGETARSYFERRKIKVQTQRIFGLGYSLPEWDGFVKYAKTNNVDLEKAALLGLIDKKEQGNYYDKFRGRIIFPIFSPNGRVIAFGGRVMEKSDSAAKYLNSPESIIYLKRKSLYGLYHSKDDIRKLDKAILVEGYLDLISLFQGGIKNVVASSGTALTEDQAQLLSRYTRNIVVFYDADPAGVKASLRSIEILLKFDFEVKIAELPEGEDPDSYITKFGKEELEDVIRKALNFLEYQTMQFEKKGAFNDPEEQTKAIRALVQSASFVKDDLKRSVLLKTISRKFNLREKLLESELEKLYSSQSGRKTEVKTNPQNEVQSHNLLVEKIRHKEAPSEVEIIKILFEGDYQAIEYIFNYIKVEDLENPDYRYLAELVYESYSAGENLHPSVLIDKVENEKMRQYLRKTALEKHAISKTWEAYSTSIDEGSNLIRYTGDTVKKFRLFKIDRELEVSHIRIKEEKNIDLIPDLIKMHNQLLNEKKMIMND